jgi:hypothetical protein
MDKDLRQLLSLISHGNLKHLLAGRLELKLRHLLSISRLLGVPAAAPLPRARLPHSHVIDKPVCGRDRKTYGNFCLAAAPGVNVKSEGTCAAGS